MQVTVETTTGLERKLTIQLPSEQIDSKVTEKLNSLRKTVKINGFRTGKIPMGVIKKRFEGQARGEVVGDLINSSFYEAVAQEKLKPAGQPSITPVEKEPEGEFAFNAVFEVYPEFEPASVESLEIEKSIVEVNDIDVDDMLETLRKQRIEWTDVERVSANGDQLIIDFEGCIDGEGFEGGSAENTPLVLGSGSMIEGFESQLVGLESGDEKTIAVTFPENYQAENIAGKDAEFEIKVHSVKESSLPEIDDEFLKTFGVENGSLEKFRTDITNNMERELAQALEGEMRNKVMDGLLSVNEFDIPKALISDEVERLKSQFSERLPAGTEVGKLGDDMFTDEASRRVRLGLIIAEIVKINEIKPDSDLVRTRIESAASTYQDPQQVIDYYYNNPEMMQNVEGLVLEQQVCDWVLNQAKVNEIDKSFKEVMDKAHSAA